MRILTLISVALTGCSASEGIGQSLLDASVLGPRLSAARESRLLTEEKVSVTAFWESSNGLLINGRGSAATTHAQVEERMMLTAAEEALKAGFRYMVPLTLKDTSIVTDYSINRPYETTVTADTKGLMVGNSYRGTTRANAITTGGPRSGEILLPGREVSFLMFETRPNQYLSGQYFNVSEIYNSLGKKHIKNFQPIND